MQVQQWLDVTSIRYTRDCKCIQRRLFRLLLIADSHKWHQPAHVYRGLAEIDCEQMLVVASIQLGRVEQCNLTSRLTARVVADTTSHHCTCFERILVRELIFESEETVVAHYKQGIVRIQA